MDEPVLKADIPIKLDDKKIGVATVYEDGRLNVKITPSELWKELIRLVKYDTVSHISFKPEFIPAKPKEDKKKETK